MRDIQTISSDGGKIYFRLQILGIRSCRTCLTDQWILDSDQSDNNQTVKPRYPSTITKYRHEIP